ncbi:MAG: rRNA maturation RNase YbeY [Candidatus Paceibacterota bacterium]
MSTTISATARSYPKQLPYAAITDAVLGKRYELSLVFVGRTRAQTLNKTTRGKSYVPNVLSFPLTDATGEIYITLEVAKREARKYNMSQKTYIAYLFVHGLLHLKGYDHGEQMERLEQKFLAAFKLSSRD